MEVDGGATQRRPEREMDGWELGGRPNPLPENENDGQDIESEAF